jgi:hypothetical protein
VRGRRAQVQIVRARTGRGVSMIAGLGEHEGSECSRRATLHRLTSMLGCTALTALIRRPSYSTNRIKEQATGWWLLLLTFFACRLFGTSSGTDQKRSMLESRCYCYCYCYKKDAPAASAPRARSAAPP